MDAEEMKDNQSAKDAETVKISLDSAETHYNAGYSDGYRACVFDIAFFIVIGAAVFVAVRRLLA